MESETHGKFTVHFTMMEYIESVTYKKGMLHKPGMNRTRCRARYMAQLWMYTN